ERERLLQRDERASAGVVVGRAAELVALKTLTRVQRGRLQQLALATALRHPDADLRTPVEREELLVELAVFGSDRNQDLLGDVFATRVGVELLDHACDQGRRLDVF